MMPLTEAEKLLNDKKIPFSVVRTSPRSPKFHLMDDCLFVVRQSVIDDELRLVVAAKMGKEVR